MNAHKILMLLLVTVVLFTMMSAGPVMAQGELETLEIRGTVEDTGAIGQMTWTANNWPAFYFDVNDPDTANEKLQYINDGVSANPPIGASGTNNVIDKGELIYTTTSASVPFNVVTSTISMNIDLMGGYHVMGWMGEKYVAIDNDPTKITKLVLEQDSDDRMNLHTGESWDLGNGYALTPDQIDVDGDKVWLTLSKDGVQIEEWIVDTKDGATAATFVATADFAGQTDEVYFVTYVDSVYREDATDLVQLKYTWLIDETDITQIAIDDTFGNFGVKSIMSGMITLANDEIITLTADDKIPFMEDMYFITSEAGVGAGFGGYLFCPVKEVTAPGIYEVRGAVEDTGAIGTITWTANNWPAFYYDINEPVIATETLAYFDDAGSANPAIGASSTNNVMDKGELTYTTGDVPKAYEVFTNVPGVTEVNVYSVMAWLGEQYVTVDGDAQKITKLVFEQDAKDTQTLDMGETWDLGNGYALSLAQIDNDGNKVWLVLSKDGVLIEDEILDADKTVDDAIFVAKADFAGKTDEVYFVTYVESINKIDGNAKFKYTWLIDKDDITTIDIEDMYGNFEVVVSTANSIVLSNDNAIILNMDDKVPFWEDVYFRVSKAGKGTFGAYLFYPAVDALIENDSDTNAPVLDPIGPKSVDENTALTFTLTASDADGDILMYSAVGLPSGASFDESTGVFTWTPVYGQAKTYLMQFTVTDGTLTDSETIMITVNYNEYFNLAGNAIKLWESTITGNISDAWNIGDVTDDDISDILFVDEFGSEPILTLYSGADGSEIWASTINGVPDWDSIYFNSIGDFDGDGVNDILMTVDYYHATVTSYTIAIKGTDGSQLWQKQESGSYDSNTWMYSIEDINGDAKDDIVYEYSEYDSHINLSIISGDSGSTIWTHTESIPSGSWAYTDSSGDLDRDGISDFFIHQGNSQLKAISGKTGSLLWDKTSEKYLDDYYSISDIDGDGYNDVVISVDDQTLIVRGYDGYKLRTIDGYFVGIIYDGNEFNDIVVSDNYNLIALDGNTGNTIWTKPVSYDVYYQYLFSIADENGDGVNDLIALSDRYDYSTSIGYDTYIGISGRDGNILWSKEFERIDEQNYSTGSIYWKYSYLDSVVDLDRNGKQYIVINEYVEYRESSYSDFQVYNNWTAIKGSDGEVLWNLNKSQYDYYEPTYMDFNDDGIFDVLDYGSYLPSSSSLTAEPAVKSVSALSTLSTSLSHNDYQLPERNQRYSDNFIRNIELNRQKFSSIDASSIVSTSAVQSSVASSSASEGSGGGYIQSYARMFSGDSIEKTLWSVDSDTRIIPINHEWWDYYYNNPNDLNSDGVSDIVLLNGDKMYALTTNVASADNVGPSITVTSHGNGVLLNTSTITVSGTASDMSGISSVTVNGIPASGKTTWSADVTLLEGENIIRVVAVDNVGNSGSKSITIVLDTIVQTADITVPENDTKIKYFENVVKGNVADAHLDFAVLTVSSGSDVLTYDLTITDNRFAQRVEFTPDLYNTLELLVFDTAGNSKTDTVTVSVFNNTWQEEHDVNNTASTIIDAMNETDTMIEFHSNVNETNVTFTVTAITNQSLVNRMNNSTSVFGAVAMGKIVKINATGIDATNESQVKYVHIELHYTIEDLDLNGDGTIESGELDENNLFIYWFNGTSGNWTKLLKDNPEWVLDSGQVKISGNNPGHVWVEVKHLSTFGLAAEVLPVPTSSTSGGSSGGGGASGEPFENIAIKEVVREYVVKGSPVTYTFKEETNAIGFIKYDAISNPGEIAVMIEVLKGKSAMVSTLPSGEVYQNMNIWVGMSGYATEKNIANPVVGFKVAKSWITENGIDESTIKLNRYSSGAWNQLPTTKIDEDDSYIYFSSETLGFSPFAITGNEISSAVADTQDTMFSPPNADDDVDGPVGETANDPDESKSSGLILVIGLICISVLGVWMYIKKNEIGK